MHPHQSTSPLNYLSRYTQRIIGQPTKDRTALMKPLRSSFYYIEINILVATLALVAEIPWYRLFISASLTPVTSTRR